MERNNNINSFDHTAWAERVINNQIEELKTEISYLILKVEKISKNTDELDLTEDRVQDLTYQIKKLTSQLERLTKE